MGLFHAVLIETGLEQLHLIRPAGDGAIHDGQGILVSVPPDTQQEGKSPSAKEECG